MSDSPSMPFTPQQALEFMQKMWNPFGAAVPGMAAPVAPGMPPAAPFPNPMAMFATLDPAEIERKIGELRVIEGWLAMTLNFMQMSIKTLELQKASLEALHAGAGAGAAAATPPQQHPRSQSQPQSRKSKPKESE
jgi:hypothetical protein